MAVSEGRRPACSGSNANSGQSRVDGEGNWSTLGLGANLIGQERRSIRRPDPLLMTVFVEVSIGELVDKLTILEIKLDHIVDAEKRANVLREYSVLEKALPPALADSAEVSALRRELKEVNERLWRIEDDIRDKERAKSFDEEFIALARSVYVTNDLRASLKRRINVCTQSNLVEEKSYQPY